jgi:RNA polymerase sigma-70 factor (ECF subfamily)
MLSRALDRIVRLESGRVLATLIRTFGEFELAEDALQDAIERALERWPRDGLPESPAAWLTTTAKRKALDRLRHRAIVRRTEPELVDLMRRLRTDEGRPDVDDAWALPDERLRLIFTCCHPALAFEARVALTLRTLGGLSTPEIARAFLVPEATLAQRLVRAKRKIREARIPYEVPGASQLPERLDAVLAVLYFVFNEGYLASSGPDGMRRELCREGIRLAMTLLELMPGEAEVEGLLALMLLHDSRRDARFDGEGQLVELDRQDRAAWDRSQIERGLELVTTALRRRSLGPYQVQAAIAAVHAEAERPEATDWPQIMALYEILYRLAPSDMVALNRIIARSMVRGPEVGLRELDAMPEASRERLRESWDLTRADLLARLGRVAEADAALARADQQVGNEGVRAFIARKRAALVEGST